MCDFSAFRRETHKDEVKGIEIVCGRPAFPPPVVFIIHGSQISWLSWNSAVYF